MAVPRMNKNPSSTDSVLTQNQNSNLPMQENRVEDVISAREHMGKDETDEMCLRERFLGWRGLFQFVLMASILIGASFLMNELVKSKKDRPVRSFAERTYRVDTLHIRVQDNQPIMKMYGDVVAARLLNLTSLVAGEVIYVNPALRQGASFQKDDILLRINPFAFEIARDEAKANVREAKAALLEAKARLTLEKTGEQRAEEQFNLARLDLERAENLLKSGSITTRVVEERKLIFSQRRAAFQTAGANIAIQEAQVEARIAALQRFEVVLRNREQQVRDTVLKAPFKGVVQMMNVELGQTISATQSVLDIYEAETLDVRFLLSDAQYGRLASSQRELEGYKVNVYWDVGQKKSVFPAHIDRIGAEITANRGGISVFARLDIVADPGSIRPGAFVSVHVPDQIFYNSFRLPESALYNGSTVYVVKSNNRLEARTVTLAAYDGQDVIITHGLNEGEEVLITQLAEAGNGLLIRTASQAENKVDKGQSAKAQLDKPRG